MLSELMSDKTIHVTDEALAQAAQQGDRIAFTILMDRYRRVAFAYAYALLQDRDEAEDAAQEAFLRAFQSLDRYRSNASWAAWMMRILRNHCLDQLRKRKGRRVEALHPETPDKGLSPEAQTLQEERLLELRRAVEALPETLRTPLLMHYEAGRTYREVALALDIPESTVTGRMAGALRALRRRMRREDGI